MAGRITRSIRPARSPKDVRSEKPVRLGKILHLAPGATRTMALAVWSHSSAKLCSGLSSSPNITLGTVVAGNLATADNRLATNDESLAAYTTASDAIGRNTFLPMVLIPFW